MEAPWSVVTARRWTATTTRDAGRPHRAPAPTGRCPGGAGRGRTAPTPAGRGLPAMSETTAPTPGDAPSVPMVTAGPPALALCPGAQFAPGVVRRLSPLPVAPRLALATRSIRPLPGGAGLTAAGPPAAPHPPPACHSTPAWGRSLAGGRRSARLRWLQLAPPPLPLPHARPRGPLHAPLKLSPRGYLRETLSKPWTSSLHSVHPSPRTLLLGKNTALHLHPPPSHLLHPLCPPVRRPHYLHPLCPPPLSPNFSHLHPRARLRPASHPPQPSPPHCRLPSPNLLPPCPHAALPA